MSASDATRKEYTNLHECRSSPSYWLRSSSPVQFSDQADSSSEEEEEDVEVPGEQSISSTPNIPIKHVKDRNDPDIDRCPPESPLLKRRPIHVFQETRKEVCANQIKTRSGHTNTREILKPKFLVLTLVLILLYAILFTTGNISNSDKSIYSNLDELLPRVEDTVRKFKNIPLDVAIQFSAGIRSILESDPTQPAVFLVLYKDTGSGSYCLANAIANLAMEYLGSSEREPLILKPSELVKDKNMTEDYGWILKRYQPLVEKHRSIIISDLQNLPGQMAMAFHFLCDIYSPVVQKALFIFTFEMRKGNTGKEIEQVESRMHEIWRNDISDDQRQALITRLTEGIISLPLDILYSQKCPN